MEITMKTRILLTSLAALFVMSFAGCSEKKVGNTYESASNTITSNIGSEEDLLNHKKIFEAGMQTFTLPLNYDIAKESVDNEYGVINNIALYPFQYDYPEGYKVADIDSLSVGDWQHAYIYVTYVNTAEVEVIPTMYLEGHGYIYAQFGELVKEKTLTK